MTARRAIMVMVTIAILAVLGYGAWWLLDTRRHMRQSNLWSDFIGDERTASQTAYVAQADTLTTWRGKPLRSRATVYQDGEGNSRVEYDLPGGRRVVIGRCPDCIWKAGGGTALTVGWGGPVNQADLDGLWRAKSSYWLERDPDASIAGRSVGVYRLVRKSTGQLYRRLWVDTETGVILAQATYGPQGQVVAETRFRTISYREKLDSALFEPPKAGKGGVAHCQQTARQVTQAELGKLVGFPMMSPRYLPSGFESQGCFALACPCGCGSQSAQLRYGDGSDVVSIFESRDEHDACNASHACGPMAGPARTTEYGRSRAVGVMRHGVSILVVGDLPAEQLAKIAQSMK